MLNPKIINNKIPIIFVILVVVLMTDAAYGLGYEANQFKVKLSPGEPKEFHRVILVEKDTPLGISFIGEGQDWFTLTNDNIALNGKKIIIPFTISIPTDVKFAGDYTTCMIIEQDDKSDEIKRVKQSVLIPIIVTVIDPDKPQRKDSMVNHETEQEKCKTKETMLPKIIEIIKVKLIKPEITSLSIDKPQYYDYDKIVGTGQVKGIPAGTLMIVTVTSSHGKVVWVSQETVSDYKTFDIEITPTALWKTNGIYTITVSNGYSFKTASFQFEISPPEPKPKTTSHPRRIIDRTPNIVTSAPHLAIYDQCGENGKIRVIASTQSNRLDASILYKGKIYNGTDITDKVDVSKYIITAHTTPYIFDFETDKLNYFIIKISEDGKNDLRYPIHIYECLTYKKISSSIDVIIVNPYQSLFRFIDEIKPVTSITTSPSDKSVTITESDKPYYLHNIKLGDFLVTNETGETPTIECQTDKVEINGHIVLTNKNHDIASNGLSYIRNSGISPDQISNINDFGNHNKANYSGMAFALTSGEHEIICAVKHDKSNTVKVIHIVNITTDTSALN